MEGKQKSKRKLKERKQIIDSVTELHDGPGVKAGRGRDGGLGVPMTQDVSDILTDQHFLPRSALVMRLLEIRDDPLAHFLPTKNTNSGTFFCAAPPGLTQELAELFMRPVRHSSSNKRRGLSQDATTNKRPRLEETNLNEEVEVGRRADSIAASVIGSETMGRASMGPDGGIDFEQPGMIDDYQLPEFVEGDTAHGLGRIHSVDPTDRSRFSTPGPDGVVPEDIEDNYADALCPIASFDARPSQTLPSGPDGEPDSSDQTNGYSKNTVKALGLLRRELQPELDSESSQLLSFRKLSDKVTKVCFLYSSWNLFVYRRLVVLLPLFSLKCLFWVHGIAFSSHKLHPLRISKFSRNPSFGNNSLIIGVPFNPQTFTHPRLFLKVT